MLNIKGSVIRLMRRMRRGERKGNGGGSCDMKNVLSIPSASLSAAFRVVRRPCDCVSIISFGACRSRGPATL
jgi:hypothetical protein